MFVKSRVPVLAPLLRSDAQGELLALLLLHPEAEYTLTEIARRVGVSLPTVHAEVARLAANGLVTDRRVGQARLVRAATGHVLFRPLAELLELTYGPIAILPDILDGVGGVREVYVYGSWAARRAGEPGDPPRDLYVLVIGTTERDVLLEVAEQAGRLLHREVNVTRISPTDWDAGEDPFVRTLRSRPLIPIPVRGDGPEGDGETTGE
jgi:DNA-binding transcriptional ArsR family regulator